MDRLWRHPQSFSHLFLTPKFNIEEEDEEEGEEEEGEEEEDDDDEDDEDEDVDVYTVYTNFGSFLNMWVLDPSESDALFGHRKVYGT